MASSDINNFEIKLADFGFARFFNKDEKLS